MSSQKISFYLAAIMLSSALVVWPIYTFPFRTIGSGGYWHPAIIATNLLALSFLVIPVLGLLGVINGWRTRYIWLAISPIVFLLFGSVPLPFASHFYSDNHQLNSVIILVINIATIALVTWLYLNENTHTNKFKN